MKKSEKGSVTVIVLATSMFLLIILGGILTAVSVKHKAQLQETKTLQQAYGQDMETLYNERIAKNLANGEWNANKGVNSPKLGIGMIPIKWIGTPDTTLTETTTVVNDNNWYNYVAQTGTTDQTSYWANAQTEDGSYWVWIPRYEYKITAAPSTTPSDTNAGTIDVKFIPTTQTTADDGYIIHPAFRNEFSDDNDNTNDYANGGWNSELPGIWVAKYKMSMETNKISTVTSTSTIGNVLTGDNVKAVSKPNVTCWRNITIGNCYTNSYNYDRAKESHLIKNSEWGAVAYLTHSKYGRNGHEIYINNSSDYITGNSGGSVNEAEAAGTTYAYNTSNGIKASSTGNITGIYDLSGDAYEYVAAFNNSDTNSYESNYGSSFAETNKSSTKYATKYENNSANTEPTSLIYKKGDSTYEVYVNSNRSWFNDLSVFVSSGAPFFIRGGTYADKSMAGLFYSFYRSGGDYPNGSFRTVLVI